MANLTQILEGLNTKEATVSTTNLAGELKASTEGTRKQLVRLKDKGYVEGDSKEGWLITDTGRKALEAGGIRPSMEDEGVTPRQKFEAIARRIGINEERIGLAADIVWSGEYTDVKWVWEALGQADIRDDLRKIWVNSWRAFLQKGIPAELEIELTGVSKVEAGAGKGGAPSKPGGREYIIVDDEPVRVGENLGDYSLQDAKDILAIRALRNRFSGAGQAGAGQTGGGTAEKVSDILTALSPYLNKGSDANTLKEILADKLELQKQDILNKIPQGQPSQPKSGIEQITEFVTAISSLKEVGPTLRSILGIAESSGNPSTGLPVQIAGPDGNPLVMDMGQVIDWRRFQNEERRADERHGALIGLAKTVRENVGDGVAALKAAATEAKGGSGTKTASEESQVYECNQCHTPFRVPQGLEEFTCPNPACKKAYTREDLKSV